jgi:hypothetical protein
MTPHATVAQAVANTLSLGDLESYTGLFVILRARLTPQERRRLAWATLMRCDDEEVEDVAKTVLPPQSRAGWPMVPLEDVVSEAAFWADHASHEELQAYAAVCLSRLPQAERLALTTPAKRRAA